MKWKFLIGMGVLTVILSLVNFYIYPIHLLIILAPIIIGTFVIISTTLLHIIILVAIWILIYVFIINKGIIF